MGTREREGAEGQRSEMYDAPGSRLERSCGSGRESTWLMAHRKDLM